MGPTGGTLLVAAAAFVGGVAVGFVVLGALARVRLRRLVRSAEGLLDPASRATRPTPADRQLAEIFERLSTRLAGVEALATTDQLTGTFNRQTSLRFLADEIERSKRYGRPVSVAIADIDHFKRVNDTYGHVAGDQLLRHVAQIMRANLRANDVIGRYGGEEFLIVLPESDLEAAMAVVEKLRRLVGHEELTLADRSVISATISIGVTSGAGQGLRLDQMTHNADSALYSAKAFGRDQVQVFRELDEERTVRRSPIAPAARDQAFALGGLAAEAAVDRLADILAPRPGWAGRPSSLIAELSIGLATSIGLPEGEVTRIRTASLLHDVGKIAIAEELLSQPRKLTQAEWQSVMEHPKIGQIVLEQAGAMRDAALIALHHHEWFNGRGYPHGLMGADIPLGARIVAITDAYEAMTTWRPYQTSKTHEEAIAELERCAGTQFDPDLVRAFTAVFREQRPSQAVPVRALRTGTDG